MKMIYQVEDKPKFKANLVFAFQQLLSIIAATLLVPTLVTLSSQNPSVAMDPSAALFGAGIGTLVYVFITHKKSPVFLGSSFAFISPLIGATAFGFLGIILGSLIAGLVYVVIALVIRFVGIAWVDKLLPPVIIGPTVALIGLSLSGSAINNVANIAVSPDNYSLIHILCGLVTFAATILASVKGKKGLKLIPFIIGVGAGYALGSIFTVIGILTNTPALMVVDYSAFSTLTWSNIVRVPEFTFVQAIKEGGAFLNGWAGIASLALLFAPVGLVVLAEHIADHENLSSVIDRNLISDPGLKNTIMGDGVGSIVGAAFGGCPNTTYGECVGCVALTGNASIYTIMTTAVMAMLLSFFNPFVQFVNTIPTCVIGGICIALYGFIAVSGLKMLQKVDLSNNKNLYVVCAILVPGIGGLTLDFGYIQITAIATALILGILTNLLMSTKKDAED